jgi:heat shock protein HslJ
MIRTVALRALLAAALVVSIPTAATAQEDGPTLEGTEWHLVAYDAGGPELAALPWDVTATLSLDAGQAFGSTGCNGFGASYELDDKALSFGQPGHTDVGCADKTMEIEAAYMAALPKVVRWAINTGATSDAGLILFDADDEHLLRFSSSDMGLFVGQIRELTDQLAAQQEVIKNLRARIKELERAN